MCLLLPYTLFIQLTNHTKKKENDHGQRKAVPLLLFGLVYACTLIQEWSTFLVNGDHSILCPDVRTTAYSHAFAVLLHLPGMIMMLLPVC